jgi:hypothetical protein
MKKILILLAFCGLLFAGCNQSRLDIPQKGVIALDDFYKTDQDAEMALVAVYEKMQTSFVQPRWNDNFILSLWNYMGDDMYAGGNNSADNAAQNELNSFRYPTNNGLVSTAYSNLYQIVYVANLAIDHFKDGLPEGGVTPTTQKVVAESKVLRALAYLYLGMAWGTPPIVDHVLDPSEKPGNAPSQDAVFDFIVQDINDALPYLTERKGPNDKDGAVRVTKGMANTVKGKALLWKGDYNGAQDALAQVIDSGNYELVPSEQLEDCFHFAGDGNPEKVFELNLVFDNSLSNYGAHAGNNMPWLWNWRNDKMILPRGEGTKMYATGWGACNPTEKFVTALIENDGIDSQRRKVWFKTFDEVLYEMPYASDDKHPEWTREDKEKDPDRGITSAEGLYAHCGYFMWKVNIQLQDLSNNNQTLHNMRIFRYPEVILMYAECATQTGRDKDKALKLVNDIQKRAGSKHISTELTLKEVKNEKYFECWLEGVRFLDLVRWGDTAELAGNGKSYPNFQDKFWSEGAPKHEGYVNKSDEDWCIRQYPEAGFKDKHKLFPFPWSEIQVNENLVQNPGW